MANAATSKPVVSRLRKWSGRFALLGLLLVLAAVAWVVGGREIVGRMVLNWARGRLERQLQESREQLPEIADYEALLRKEVKGTNGWEHIEAGCRATDEIELRHQGDKEKLFSTTWCGGFADAWNSARASSNSGGLGRIRPERFAHVLAETAVLTEHAKKAAGCDTILGISNLARKKAESHSSPDAGTADFVGVLITRVRLLVLSNKAEAANEELVVLVRLAAKLCVRSSKYGAISYLGIRNDVLEQGVLPLLKAKQCTKPTRELLLNTRWRTLGNDSKLWLNNAAGVYDYVQYGLSHDPDKFFWLDAESPFRSSLTLLSYADWMNVATKNAQAAKRGELDLRDKNWVKYYNAQYESEFALVNGVVPCGLETMSSLVREIEREDKLWAEIEALCK